VQAVITMAKRKTRAPKQPTKPEQTTAPKLLGKTGELAPATFDQIRAALKPRYEIFSLKEVMRRWAAFTLDIESRWGNVTADAPPGFVPEIGPDGKIPGASFVWTGSGNPAASLRRPSRHFCDRRVHCNRAKTSVARPSLGLQKLRPAGRSSCDASAAV
jgi:hypothetical protein